MTCVIALKLRDENGPRLAVQVTLFPEAAFPADTLAASENRTGLYLESNGIFEMVRNLVKNTDDVRHPYITHLNADSHAGLPPAILVTNGFDPLRDVGHAYAQKLAAADNDLTYMHNPGLTHGFPQFTRSSAACHQATLDLADLSKPRSDSRSADPPRAPLKPVRQVMADQTVSGPTEPLQLAPTKAISVQ
jgi:acetyl esterase